jgi:hypothetical protein
VTESTNYSIKNMVEQYHVELQEEENGMETILPPKII